jgi:tetratricopeptide (TPR) repeat protein
MLVNIRFPKLLGSLLFAAVAFAMTAVAWADDDDDRQDRSLTPSVAVDLLAAFELMEEDQNREALTKLNELMSRRAEQMTGFDRASVLQIRGSAHVNLENLDEGLNDFAEALALGALPSEQNTRLRLNLAQLYFITERYEESIEFFNRWLREDDTQATENTYFMLGAAYYHLDRYEEALDPIDRSIEVAAEPSRRTYELKNVLLNELERVADRTELMKEMVTLWPDELSFWRQLSSLYLERDMQLESFGVLESAYLSGLIESADDITLLAQFYSTFNNPHRGAKLIEEELERGRLERNVENLQLLSQLLSQAREHRRAIPVLREAAQLADTGELSYRLGQALLADERNEEAEAAFVDAIDKGELDDAKLAEIWVLLGTARFNQAGPGDRQQRRVADEAFAQAERFASTRTQAREWRGYIRAINETETRQAQLEQEQSERLEEAARERTLQSCRALQIAGRELSDECRELLGEPRD